VYKKHVSEIDSSVTFFSVDKDFWFAEGNPEYDNYLVWLEQGNTPEESDGL
jgi:hypothetical protein